MAAKITRRLCWLACAAHLISLESSITIIIRVEGFAHWACCIEHAAKHRVHHVSTAVLSSVVRSRKIIFARIILDVTLDFGLALIKALGSLDRIIFARNVFAAPNKFLAWDTNVLLKCKVILLI